MEQQPRNIIACSDGTGNTTVKGRGSNVFKLYEAVALNDGVAPEQVAIYDDGIGTQNFSVMRAIAGAFGHGLKRNVRQLYIEISRAYKPGDQIYLFGFSRGAFTVRLLAGLIVTQGLIDCKNVPATRINNYARAAQRRLLHDHIKQAFLQKVFGGLVDFLVRGQRYDYKAQDYIHYDSASASGEKPEETGTEVAFVGAWDTVEAVGFPIAGLRHVWDTLVYKFSFPDQLLHKRVRAAAHALSIDDQRATFHPTVWDETECGVDGDHRINQVWFGGVHSNVGGGYPKQGMSHVTLDWMMEEAKQGPTELPIRFDQGQREEIAARANVDDKLYDSRSGASKFYRYAPREIAEICRKKNIPVRIHRSVLYRTLESRTEAYTPRNIPTSFDIVGEGSRSTFIPMGPVQLQGLEAVKGFSSARSRWDIIRQVSQVLLIGIATPLAFWCIWGFDRGNATASLWDRVVPCDGLTDCFWTPFSSNLTLLAIIGSAIAILYGIAKYADNRSRQRLLELWEMVKVVKKA